MALVFSAWPDGLCEFGDAAAELFYRLCNLPTHKKGHHGFFQAEKGFTHIYLSGMFHLCCFLLQGFINRLHGGGRQVHNEDLHIKILQDRLAGLACKILNAHLMFKGLIGFLHRPAPPVHCFKSSRL